MNDRSAAMITGKLYVVLAVLEGVDINDVQGRRRNGRYRLSCGHNSKNNLVLSSRRMVDERVEVVVGRKGVRVA